MLAFAIIGVLVLLLIFFVMRSQSLLKQLNMSSSTIRQQSKKSQFAMANVQLLADQLQKQVRNQLAASRKRGLIGEKQGEVFEFIFSNITQVVLACCEKSATVEEALTNALKETPVTMEQVREVIKEQPSDVRVAWCKNTVDGFIIACNQISLAKIPTEKNNDADSA